MRYSGLALCAVGVSASTISRIVHEKRAELESRHGWIKRDVEEQNAVIEARVGLKQMNLELANDHIMDISHPHSDNYGKFWTREQVEQTFSPSVASIDAVMKWLSDAGIQQAKQTSNRGWIAFNTSIENLENLLDAKFYQYQHDRTRSSSYVCSQYSLPSEIAPHVDYVLPGVKPMSISKFGQGSKTHHRRDLPAAYLGPAKQPTVQHPHWHRPHLPSDLQNCGYNITPPCLRALYDLPNPDPKLVDGQLGIYEESGSYSQEDLNDFFAKYAPYVPNSTHPYLVSINGAAAPASPTDASAETDLDFQIAYGLLGPSNLTLYQAQGPANLTGQPVLMEDLLDAIDGSFCDDEDREKGFMCGGDSLTNVLSVSMESPELFEQSKAFQERACNEFMKLGLQGKTIIFSSGDYGVAANPAFGEPFGLDNGCAPQDLQNHPELNNVLNGTIFLPGFPSNCPYVLSVGGTMLEPNETVYGQETAMNLPGVGESGFDGSVTFSSSGGFSNYFSRPSYQDDAVLNYYSKFNPSYRSYDSNNIDVSDNSTSIGKHGGIYNRIGRGIPDVSASGAHFMSYNDGQDMPTDGTSVSAPIWGSIIAMINGRRAEVGKGPVGFINPVLYSHPHVFHDITSGSNPGCGTAGFEAVEGWDPITGLGTPNYPALERLFLSMP